MVQLAGHDMLKAKGIALIAASAPMFFLEDIPTAVLVRQVLGAIAQFEKGWARRQACGCSEAQARH
jgi:DNA invertase Pin-like site-specific DNA recombinase